MKKLLLLCFLCLATSITFAQEQPPTPQLQVGDTVTVNKDATHYLTGERISRWVYLVKHRIRQIGTKKWVDGVLIRGINSWLAPTAVTKVGEHRVAAEPQSAPKAVIVTAEPQEEPKEVIVVTGDSIEEATPQKQAPIVLRGRLVSQNGDFVVAGARVSLANQNISTQTNAAGEFTFYYIEPGDEELLVDAEGFISTVELVQILQDQSTDLGDINLEQDIVKEAQEEILLNLSEEEMNDDEGRSQAQAASSSASTDVFNSTISFAWSTARYRNRGYTAATAENYYIEGLNFNSAERGQFNYSAMGGLNDASRYKEVLNPIEATNFTFGNIGQSTNYLMGASRYAQGWKIGVAGTNRNYKARVSASYASGVLPSGWAVITQLAYRFAPPFDNKGMIGEGIHYYSLGYYLSAEKIWANSRLKLLTFGAPTERGQNAAVTQEVYDLTGTNNYNPYWGYQNGKVRNSRIVKSFDPTVIAAFEHMIDANQRIKIAAGFHYSMYSNSAINYFNAPNPSPDYYRNLPSFFWDGQIANPNGNSKNSNYQLYGEDGHYPWGLFIGNSQGYPGPGSDLGEGFLADDGNWIGPSIDPKQYNNLVHLWQSRDNKTTQIDWEAIYAANYANNHKDELSGEKTAARYMVERRHNDIMEAVGSFNYVTTQHDHMKMTLGLEGKFSQGIHYKTIDDLLGANQWIDIDAFADRDIKELATNSGFTQEDIRNVRKNDIASDYNDTIRSTRQHFGYDYRINMANAKAWFQTEWNFNEVDFYYGIQLTYSSMQRLTNMVNGRAWYLTKVADERGLADSWKYYGANAYNIISSQIDPETGKNTLKAGTRYYGEAHHFLDPAFKLGVTYKINGRNRLKLNGLAETRAPYARDAYISSRVHDRVVENIYTHDHAKSIKDFYISNEKVVSADLSYEFNYPIVRGRITGFFTQTWNGTELNSYYDDDARTLVNQAMTGINKRYMGAEAAVAVKLGTYFTLTAATSIGDYRYTSDAIAVQSAENGMPMTRDDATGSLVFETTDKVLLKGIKLSTGPQLNASLKLSFFHPKMWFADITVNYHDWNYLAVAPSRRMQGLYTGTRLDGTHVNGWFGDSYANAIATTDDKSPRYQYDANNNVLYSWRTRGGVAEYVDPSSPENEGNIIVDKNGIPSLKYPYNLMTMQESLSSTNPLNRFIIDVSVGKMIYLPKRQSININLSVTNITNNTHFKTGGYQQARLPRGVLQGEKDYHNSVISPNAWKYPSKYYYAWGMNFYLSFTYKF